MALPAQCPLVMGFAQEQQQQLRPVCPRCWEPVCPVQRGRRGHSIRPCLHPKLAARRYLSLKPCQCVALQSSGPTATRELCRGSLLEIRRLWKGFARKTFSGGPGFSGMSMPGFCRMPGHCQTLQHPIKDKGFPSPCGCSVAFRYPG